MCTLSNIVFVVHFLAVQLNVPTKAFLSLTNFDSLIFYEPPFSKTDQRTNEVSEHYFTQRLDNFDPQNMQTFQMRYLMNDKYFRSGGPVILMVGGEWTVSPGHLLKGQHIYDMAEEFNALLIYTEHRYYGKTKPTKSISTENLKYLSVEQSLADLAHFIRNIRSDKSLNATGGVVMAGGSYAGTMVTWFRQKYPHLVDGVWASSAPLNAKLDFFEYKEVVGTSFKSIGGDKCVQRLSNSFHSINELIANDQVKQLRTLFNLCDDFDGKDKYDLWHFHSFLSDILSGVVQRHKPGDIEKVCDFIENATSSKSNDDNDNSADLHGFAEFVRSRFSQFSSDCIHINYNDSITDLTNDEWSSSSTRQWLYQTCSEFGWYQTSSSDKQPFGKSFPIDLYLRLCRDMFGSAFTKDMLDAQIERKNDIYGGISPKVSNVFFTQGSVDPWHRMGILNDLNENSPAIIIPGASHCNDFQSINVERDSEEMVRAKTTIRKLFRKWLNV